MEIKGLEDIDTLTKLIYNWAEMMLDYNLTRRQKDHILDLPTIVEQLSYIREHGLI